MSGNILESNVHALWWHLPSFPRKSNSCNRFFCGSRYVLWRLQIEAVVSGIRSRKPRPHESEEKRRHFIESADRILCVGIGTQGVPWGSDRRPAHDETANRWSTHRSGSCLVAVIERWVIELYPIYWPPVESVGRVNCLLWKKEADWPPACAVAPIGWRIKIFIKRSHFSCSIWTALHQEELLLCTRLGSYRLGQPQKIPKQRGSKTFRLITYIIKIIN